MKWFKCSSTLPVWKSYKCVYYASMVKISHHFWDFRMKLNVKTFYLASTVAGQKCTTAQATFDTWCCYLDSEHVTISIQVLYCCWQHERIIATTNSTQHKRIIATTISTQHERIMATTISTQHERIMATNILISGLFSFLGSFCMSLSVLWSSMGSAHSDSLWEKQNCVDASSTCQPWYDVSVKYCNLNVKFL